MELWAEESGAGHAVLFLHGGLGDSRLWEPIADIVARRFRCIRYDLRFYGRSSGPAEEWSSIDDAVAILDRFDVDRTALVGLSLGGGLAIDVALAHPERVWAIAHVAGGVTGMPMRLSAEQEAAYDEAEAAGLEAQMAFDFDLWAPLGADDSMRDMWLATPDARGLPDGARPRPRPDAHERLGEVAVPTLVVVAEHDPPGLKDIGRTAAHRIPGARLVEVDSDHYLTLRRSEELGELLLEFLAAAAPA